MRMYEISGYAYIETLRRASKRTPTQKFLAWIKYRLVSFLGV